MSYEWCRGPDVALPAPDLTLFLAVSPSVQAARGGFGGERYEKEDTQRRVADVFERIAEEVSGGGGGSGWFGGGCGAGRGAVYSFGWRGRPRCACGGGCDAGG